MSENFDNLLVEAFAKSLFKGKDQEVEEVEEGEIDKEEGEINSSDELKEKKDHKHKKSRPKSKHKLKLKSKSKSKSNSKSISKKLLKKSSKICSKVGTKTKLKSKSSSNGKKSRSKHKKSKSSDKSSKTKTKTSDENESEVMKLLLSKQLKTYADIEFKEEPNSPEKEEPKKSSKHKSSKRDNEKHEKSDKHSDKRKRHKRKSSEEYYEKQKDSYYWTHSSNEDYFYGSYYEGSDSLRKTNRSHRGYSRPLSPLFDNEWRHRSRSRSPLDYNRQRRSISPTSRYYSQHRSRSPEDDIKRRYRRSISPGNRSYRSCSVSSRLSVSSRSSVDRIDKKKLLEIARINLVKMIENGDLPKGTDINKLKLRHLRDLTTQKSVQQWTEFCRAISALESAAADDSDLDIDYDSDNDDIKSVASDNLISIRHPFKLNERKDIQIRLRGFPQLPSRSAKELALELREQFPVSSGNQHRKKEINWIEVDSMPPPALPAPKLKGKKIETKLTEIMNIQWNIPEETLAYRIIPSTTANTSVTTTETITSTDSTCDPITTSETTAETSLTTTTTTNTSITTTTISAAPVPSTSSTETTSEKTESEPKTSDSVFPMSSMPIDIGSVMAQRLNAMRKLQDDPHNVVALKQMYQANQMVDNCDI